MSVYTDLRGPELEDFLSRYNVGQLLDFVGIADGIENSNYFITTDQGRFVLTLFEHEQDNHGLHYCLALMAYLSEQAIPSARPMCDVSRNYLGTLKNKPTALVERLRGASVSSPSLGQCQIIGTTLATMHVAAQSYPAFRKNERGRDWHVETAAQIRDHLPAADQALLDTELAFLQAFDFGRCPQGVIHADLFRDNVLFEGSRLSGLIDFYYAHNGSLLYDLAVTVCDWCFNSDAVFEEAKAHALVGAYATTRVVAVNETEAWLPCLRSAGLRFWLSRLKDRLYPRGGQLTHIKDPDPFKAILQACHRDTELLLSVWH
jgi:homoserine kinase type II